MKNEAETRASVGVIYLTPDDGVEGSGLLEKKMETT